MRPVSKTVHRVVATLATAGATHNSVIDTNGFSYATIVVGLQGVEATTAPAVIALQESVDTNASNYANVTGFVGGTSFTIPTTMRTLGENSPTTVKMGVDCRARKRYLRTAVSVGTHCVVTQHTELSLGDQGPFTATPAGVDVLVNG